MGDPSSFYRINEELAAELARLDREGHLERLRALLAAGDAELWVASVRPHEGLEELLGRLRAPQEPTEDDEAGGGWDHEGTLAARSRVRVVAPDGAPRELYLPDHVCPYCYNETDNVIDRCARRCGACDATW
ncbi:MAG: hypothetical protein D6731_05045 [Planctomycetota bacterium]|nr:MAG: hypothetical protein D6731_05045 [Planctomycetota bacterium]